MRLFAVGVTWAWDGLYHERYRRGCKWRFGIARKRGAIAILVGAKLGEQPFTRINLQARALHHVAGRYLNLAIRQCFRLLPDTRFVRQLHDVFGYMVEPNISRARVSRGKFCIIDQAITERAFRWIAFVSADGG